MYRRCFLEEGGSFVADLPVNHFREMAAEIKGLDVIHYEPAYLQCAEQILSSVDRPICVGLRDATGALVSFVLAWQERDRVTVFLQMNAVEKHPKANLSMVLRGFLCEYLIANGIKELCFWNGMVGRLLTYSQPVSSKGAFLDSNKPYWRFCLFTMSVLFRIFKPKPRPALYWLSRAAPEIKHGMGDVDESDPGL